MKSTKVKILFLLALSLLFSNCEKEANESYKSDYRILLPFENGNPFEGEVIIYNLDTTRILGVVCDPEYAIFDEGFIEYGYEINLKRGTYIFEMVKSQERKSIIQKVEGDIHLQYP